MTTASVRLDWSKAVEGVLDEQRKASDAKFEILKQLVEQDYISQADHLNAITMFEREIKALNGTARYLSFATMMHTPTAHWPSQTQTRQIFQTLIDNKDHIQAAMTDKVREEIPLLAPGWKK